jgi:hypothetical protein
VPYIDFGIAVQEWVMITLFEVISLDPIAHQLHINNALDKSSLDKVIGTNVVHSQHRSKATLHASDAGCSDLLWQTCPEISHAEGKWNMHTMLCSRSWRKSLVALGTYWKIILIQVVKKCIELSSWLMLSIFEHVMKGLKFLD